MLEAIHCLYKIYQAIFKKSSKTPVQNNKTKTIFKFKNVGNHACQNTFIGAQSINKNYGKDQ